MTTRGKFITFEGGEGVGKTTLINGLSAKLSFAGITVDLTREPGGTPIAEALRGVLLDPDLVDEKNSVMTEALILAAARRNHVDQRIVPNIENSIWVLCDRFLDSTRAYQGSLLRPEELRSIEALATGGLRPDLTILLDADPKLLLQRRSQRGQTNDRFEARPISYHEGVRTAFLRVAGSEPDRFLILDALKGPDDLVETAFQAICQRFSVEAAAEQSETSQ